MSEPLAHQTTKVISGGASFPLGATPSSDGVNFAVYSRNATAAFLLLFDTADGEPTDVIELTSRDKFVWHAFVRGLRPGQLYGYKVRGDYRPEWGLRFNDAKLLLDPYAKAVTGKFRNTDNLLLAYDPRRRAGGSRRRRPRQHRDRAQGDRRRRRLRLAGRRRLPTSTSRSWSSTRCTSRGSRRIRRPAVEQPGHATWVSSRRSPISSELGVNAVELLPVHEYYVDDFLHDKGLTNYWGYNSIGFFAPGVVVCGRHARPAARSPSSRPWSASYTGRASRSSSTSSTTTPARATRWARRMSLPRPRQPLVLQPDRAGRSARALLHELHGLRQQPATSTVRPSSVWSMDSLRYWVEVMHVDGFRFDLASVLGRDEGRRVQCVGAVLRRGRPGSGPEPAAPS